MMLNSQKTLLLIIILFFVYFLQGIIYSTGNIISISCISIIIAIEFGCTLWLFLQGEKNTPIILMQTLFFILLITFLVSPFTVWGTAYEAIGEISTQSQFKASACFILMYPTTYLLCKKQKIKIKYYTMFSIGLLILSILQFIYYQITMQTHLNSDGDITNNGAYWFVCLLPFLPIILERRPFITLILFLISIFFIITGAKRGAIVCLCIASLFSLFFYLRHRTISFHQIIILTLSLLSIIAFALYLYSTNEYLQMRFQTTNEAGIGTRGIAYKYLLTHWQTDDNLFTSFLGHGTAQTVAVWGNFAHNDWLELLIDNGIIGVILYACLFLSLFMQIYRSSIPFSERWAAYLCLIIWGLKSSFSMGYTEISSSLLLGLLGTLSANSIYYNKEIYPSHY